MPYEKSPQHPQRRSCQLLLVSVLGPAPIPALLVALLGSPALAQSDPGATVTTAHETIPNPVYGSTFRVAASCQGAVTPCAWEASATWTEGAVPTASTDVIVDGIVQIHGTATALHVGVYPGGALSFDPDNDTSLSTGDLMVFEGGTLLIGTEAEPIAASAELVIRDLPFTDDPEQHLRTLLAVNGTVRIHGRTIAEPFVRTAAEIQAGASTVQLEQSALAAGWLVGDAVLVPKSSQCPFATDGTCSSETEERNITAISGDGKTVTLSSPLAHAHPGARDKDGNLDFLPHVLDVERNVALRSENPNGNRGHALFHGRADVMVRYARFQAMGRTNIDVLGSGNQKGRYPLHAHHLIGPLTPQPNGYQFTFVGNVIDFGADNANQNRKWGITVHGSHYGLIEGNIVDRASGAGIVTEGGSESGNVFRTNFVLRIVGGNGERTHDPDPGDGSKLGRAGVAFWFNGPGNNSIRDNVAADVAECTYCYGFKFDNVYNGTLTIPQSQGADPAQGGGVVVDAYDVPLADFAHNEAYAVPNGLTIWWLCTQYESPRDTCASTVSDFHVWHFHRWGYFGYESNQLTLDHFVARGDAQILTNPFEEVTGLWFGDYMQRKLVVQNADLQGMANGITGPTHRDERGASGEGAGVTIIKDSLINAATGISVLPPASVNGSADLSPIRTLVGNVAFSYPATSQSANVAIHDDTFGGGGTPNQALRNDTFLCNYTPPGAASATNLYILPDYHDASHCDPALADCSTNLATSYPEIDAAKVYQASALCNTTFGDPNGIFTDGFESGSTNAWEPAMAN